ncbi:helix-turn-helix domain-containing protein [Agromyces mediolanus]|uniref:helix-turn-helix domain-containing protein n=1 Tax=Agromyces mediolanus TaxID=41986 RepID=UPI00166E18E3
MLVRTLEDIGPVVRQRRRSRGITQSELAAQAGTTRQLISRIENGARDVNGRILLAVLDALELNVELKPARTVPLDAPILRKSILTDELVAALRSPGVSGQDPRCSHLPATGSDPNRAPAC